MHDPDYSIMGIESEPYNTDKFLYEGLLNSAPEVNTSNWSGGPATNCAKPDWTSESRCLWPQQLEKGINDHPDQDNSTTTSEAYASFNGLDYMMLHNLYYIAYRKEDLMTLDINQTYWLDNIFLRSSNVSRGSIYTGSSILGTDVTYTARKQVKLMPGFSANSVGGKKFKATVTHRPNNYFAGAYIQPSNYEQAVSQAMVSKRHINIEPDIVSNDSISIDDVNVSPNPCKELIEISITSNDFPINYCISNVNGVLLSKNQLTTNHQSIDMSGFGKGIYLLTVCLKNITVTKKIIHI